ncbi:MAG: glutathione peroxidase [Myxococcota bacterium]|jgi:glutathione peroxidase
MARIDYDTPVTTLGGDPTTLADHTGKVMLVVNTASQCGFTPQYAGLERLWSELGDKGLVVLGFPCNQFGRQEPGSAEDISGFCELNYGVSFPMYDKVEVNGGNTHALFAQLKAAAPGLLGSTAIKWNFTKFLVDRNGEVVKRYGPRTTPRDIQADIEGLL